MADKGTFVLGMLLAVGTTMLPGTVNGTLMIAQSPAHAATVQRGTVKAVSGSMLTIETDAGSQVVVAISEGARLLRVAPGSTNLSAAQTISLADISIGDKVLVSGNPGDATGTLTAMRVILMKSGDIAQKHAEEQADWQKRGSGGIIDAVDAQAGTITFSSGAKKMQIETNGTTVFRRYAQDSVKFEDSKPGTITQLRPGDQLRVLGSKSEDGLSIKAEEIVSGSFLHLSGVLTSIDPSAGTVTLKDLVTKKTMSVAITANSALRKLPPEVATRFATRQRGGNGGASAPGGRPVAAAGTETGGTEGGIRAAGMDLSRMLARLPNVTLADLHSGDAVMIVASQSQSGSDKATAVTLLAGVEPILAAKSSGSEAITLSPWSVGGGAPEGGEGQQ